MRRKVFVKKNPQSGGRPSHSKLLLWAALGLMVLVLVVPLLTRKATHIPTPKPVAMQKGTLFAKIPKAASLKAEKQAMQYAGMKPIPIPQHGTPAPAVTASQVQADTGGTGAAPLKQTAGQQASLAVTAAIPTPSAATGAGKDSAEQTPSAPATFAASTPPVQPVSSAAVSGTLQPVPAPAAAAVAHAKQKTPVKLAEAAPRKHRSKVEKAAPGRGWEYIVQVGCFHDPRNADNLRKKLVKKGYDAVIKPYRHPTLGLLHIVELRPIHKLSLAKSMLDAIQKTTRSKPILIRVRAGQ